MTKFERRNIGNKLLTKYQAQGIRRTHFQSGYQETFADGERAKIELAADSMQLSDTSGWVNREQDPNAWRDDITGAINAIQSAIEKTSNDDGLQDALNTLLSTANILVRVPNGSLVRKAKCNPSGQTMSPVVVASNTQARTPGSKPIVISSAELAQWAQESPSILRLAAKYPHLFAEENQ